MAISKDSQRRTRRQKSDGELEGGARVTHDPDVSEVRRIRIERLEGSSTPGRSTAIPEMASESHTTLPSQKSRASHRRRKSHRHHSGDEETRHRRRRKSSAKEDSDYVYSPPTAPTKSKPTRITVSDTRRPSHDGESSDSGKDSIKSDHVRAKPKKRKIRIVYVDEEDSKPRERRSRRSEKETRDRSRDREGPTRHRKPEHARRHSTVELPSTSHRRYGICSIHHFSSYN